MSPFWHALAGYLGFLTVIAAYVVIPMLIVKGWMQLEKKWPWLRVRTVESEGQLIIVRKK